MNMITLSIISPLIGFVLLAFSHNSFSRNLNQIIGISSIGIAMLATAYTGIDFFKNGCRPFNIPLWTWISTGDFIVNFNLVLDTLSLRMLFIITSIGFLIHVFSSWYMRNEEEGYSRFFAYTNLFIASMIVLVLADNLLLMYLGWEGVGLCSYFLINFYYTNPKNGTAAMKAFIITRIGDVFLIFSLFILCNELGTINFRDLAELAPAHFKENSNVLSLSTLMLLIASISKSAQFPLQIWLADAMAAPTPVSALIHASTMVTAGVYLITRTQVLFLMTPKILYLVAITGVLTLIMASFSALVQINIKRILAYSTMSQIGYMFLAMGARSWDAAIFHLMTHAFFKALLFLSSSSITMACHHEQNIFKMGGLRKSIPLVYLCFLIGGASLSAFPLVTAGFFSKDAILIGAMTNGYSSLMLLGLVGTFITSLYTFRAIFTIFHGKEQISAHPESGITHNLPLIILLILSSFIGALIFPLSQNVLVDTPDLDRSYILILKIVSSTIVIVGILVSAWLWIGKRTLVNAVSNSMLGRLLGTWFYNSWGFNWLYNLIFVQPFLRIAWILKYDPLNSLINIPVVLVRFIGKKLLLSESGYLRWYIASMSIGAIIVLLFLILLSIILN